MADLCMHELHRCADCHTPTAHERTPDSRPFTARYDGECAGCGFDVRAGDRVRFANGGRLYHERCV